MDDFNVKLTVRNARLLSAIRESYGSAAELSRQMGEAQSAVAALVTMRIKPFNSKGWTRLAESVAFMLSKQPDELWPEHMREVKLAKSSAELELGLKEVQELTSGVSSEVRLSQQKVLSDFMGKLTDRHREAVNLYYFENRTFEEIGEHFNVSTARARQIVQTALQKMRIIAVRSGYMSRANPETYYKKLNSPRRLSKKTNAGIFNSEWHLLEEDYGLKGRAFELLGE